MAQTTKFSNTVKILMKPKLFVLFLIASGFVAAPALATCGPESKTLFSCSATKSSKLIEVCDDRTDIQYSFGKPGVKPDIALTVARNQVSTYQWDGMGSAMTYSVNIPNGSTEYRVFSGAEKGPTGNRYAGVNVVINGKRAATVQCVTATVKENLDGLKLKTAQEW